MDSNIQESDSSIGDEANFNECKLQMSQYNKKKGNMQKLTTVVKKNSCK